jgi:hypothetical protein
MTYTLVEALGGEMRRAAPQQEVDGRSDRSKAVRRLDISAILRSARSARLMRPVVRAPVTPMSLAVTLTSEDAQIATRLQSTIYKAEAMTS